MTTRRGHLLDVVHEVESQGARRAGVQRGEDAGLPVGRHFLGAAEARVLEQSDHQFAALIHPAVLRGDGGLADPFLEPLDCLVVAFLDLREHGFDVRRCRSGSLGRARRPRESRRAGDGALKKSPSVHAAKSIRRGGDSSASPRPSSLTPSSGSRSPGANRRSRRCPCEGRRGSHRSR